MRGNLHMRCAAWYPDPTVLGKCKAAVFGFDDWTMKATQN